MIIMGNFNEILSVEESRGQTRETHGMRKFKEWIECLHLVDLPLNGRRYTWRRGNSRSKLDRFLGNSEWLSKISELRVTGHYTEVSDHVCMSLRLNAQKNWPGTKTLKMFECVAKQPKL